MLPGGPSGLSSGGGDVHGAQLTGGLDAVICNAGTGLGSGVPSGWTTNYDTDGFVVGGDHFVVPAVLVPAGRRGVFLVTAALEHFGPSPNIPGTTLAEAISAFSNTDAVESGASFGTYDHTGIAFADGMIDQVIIAPAGVSVTLADNAAVTPAAAGHFTFTYRDWTIVFLGLLPA